MSFLKNQHEAETKYGKIDIKTKYWPDEAKHMATFIVPAGFEHVINSLTGKQWTKVYCNKDIHGALGDALANLIGAGLNTEMKTFDGGFMIREVRGVSGAASTHSYGLALDFNAATNKLGEEPSLSAEFVKCFTNANFAWGGNFHRKDGMHFSMAWE